MEFEDVGGQAVDDNTDEPDNSDVEGAGAERRIMVTHKVQHVKRILRLLARGKEIAKARQSGRTPDDCKAILKVANVYGSILGDVLESFPVAYRKRLTFHIAAPHALEMKERRAEAIRRQCDGGDDDAEELVVEEVHSSLTSTPSVELFDVDDVVAGPRHVAWKLCQAASRNTDQKRAVALVAQPVQAALENNHVMLSETRRCCP